MKLIDVTTGSTYYNRSSGRDVTVIYAKSPIIREFDLSGNASYFVSKDNRSFSGVLYTSGLLCLTPLPGRQPSAEQYDLWVSMIESGDVEAVISEAIHYGQISLVNPRSLVEDNEHD